MNSLADLQNWLGTLLSGADSLRLVFPAVLALLAFVLGLSLALVLGGMLDPLKRRVGAVANDAEQQTGIGSVRAFLNRIGGILIPKKERKRSNIARQIELAGFRSPQAFRFFFAFRLIAMIGIPVLILAWSVLTGSIALADAVLYAVGGAAIAYVLPDFWLARRVKKRQERLRRALPDVLDLLVVCTEAGLGLNAAIRRVADEMEIQHPEMSDELRLVTMHIRAGMDNRSAFNDLQQRTGLEEIRSFVATLLQSMRFGTSIADSLRVFAEDLRDKRLQRAQERAAKLGVKMIAPIAIFIMPSFLLVALGPALFALAKSLGHLGSMSSGGPFP